MARVTVEDCVERIPNRFELVMTAAQRSRDISAGASITVERDNDKNPVVALREIAEESIDLEKLQDDLVRGLQKIQEIDEPEEDEPMEAMAAALVGQDGGFEDMPAGMNIVSNPGAEAGADADTAAAEKAGGQPEKE